MPNNDSSDRYKSCGTRNQVKLYESKIVIYHLKVFDFEHKFVLSNNRCR